MSSPSQVLPGFAATITSTTPPRITRGRRGLDCSEWGGVVEVAAAFGLPPPTAGPFAVAALASPLHLGRRPLEGGANLISLDLGDRPLVALRGLPSCAAAADQ
jgi:hypothetical protein